MYAELRYGATFGKGDSSGWIEWEIELTEKESEMYQNAVRLRIPLEEIEELEGVLQRAYDEIEAAEIENLLEIEDEYTMECQGILPVDPDEINDMVASGDEHAIAYFGLEELSQEQLEEWNANNLDELPLIKDFNESFEPFSPFELGWTLKVEFADPNEEGDIDEDEFREVICDLIREAKDDYSIVKEYIERVENNAFFEFELEDVVEELFEKFNIK